MITHFRDLDQLEAGSLLGEWADRHGVQVDFEARRVRDLEVIFVLFSER